MKRYGVQVSSVLFDWRLFATVVLLVSFLIEYA